MVYILATHTPASGVLLCSTTINTCTCKTTNTCKNTNTCKVGFLERIGKKAVAPMNGLYRPMQSLLDTWHALQKLDSQDLLMYRYLRYNTSQTTGWARK